MNHYLNSLHGTITKSCVIDGFTLTETGYTPTLRLPKHSHKAAYFCFVLQGSFTEFYGQQKKRHCSSSTLIFHPSEEKHSDQFHALTRCFNLLPGRDWVERMNRYSNSLERSAIFNGGVLVHLATRLYKEFRQMDELSPIIVEGLSIEILGAAARLFLKDRRGGPQPWLRQAKELLHDQFQDYLSLSKVASAVGVHETHLCREFRRHNRCTVGEYIRRLRVEYARRELSTTVTPIIDIALAAGFTDQSHFARTFKRHTGMSPAAYRRTFRTR